MAERSVLSKESVKTDSIDQLSRDLTAYEIDKVIAWAFTTIGATTTVVSIVAGNLSDNESTETATVVAPLVGMVMVVVGAIGIQGFNSASKIVINEAQSRGLVVQEGFIRRIKSTETTHNSNPAN